MSTIIQTKTTMEEGNKFCETISRVGSSGAEALFDVKAASATSNTVWVFNNHNKTDNTYKMNQPMLLGTSEMLQNWLSQTHTQQHFQESKQHRNQHYTKQHTCRLL